LKTQIATQKLIDEIYSLNFNPQKYAKTKLLTNPVIDGTNNKRPLSMSFEGGGFGDEGKGITSAREARRLTKDHDNVVMYRWNGGSNAGHECLLPNKKLLAVHQFPLGVALENTTSICGKGMVINPGDAVFELDYIIEITGKKIKE